MNWDIVVVGAGAAGLFAALRAKALDASLKVLVLEASPKPLRKVAISGGGRCNVTHDCDDIDQLLASYPRGGPRLEAIFPRFMPCDTVAWFQKRGVQIKTEKDGRMFPVTNSSQTIIDCLLQESDKLKIELRTKARVQGLRLSDSDRRKKNGGKFELQLESGKLFANRVLLATGGASKATEWLRHFGHQLVADIPSLFTFCCTHPVIEGLQGLSVKQTELLLKTSPQFLSDGPLLITHWGLSGPAVLKLSSFAARVLAANDYRAELEIDLLPHLSFHEIEKTCFASAAKKQIGHQSPFSEIPKRLWRSLVHYCHLQVDQSWESVHEAQIEKLAATLKALSLPISGKGIFKEEFVTAGGVPLHEIDVYTMESRKVTDLFIAGELLDVDGITGGFNFQNAWATGFIAGESMAG